MNAVEAGAVAEAIWLASVKLLHETVSNWVWTKPNWYKWFQLVLVSEILAETEQLGFQFGKKWPKPNQTKLP